MANTFTLSGTSLDAENNPAYVGRYMEIRVTSVGTDTEDAAAYPQDTVSFLIDASGDWSATTLWVNGDSGITSLYEITDPSGQRLEFIFPTAVAGTTVRYEYALENYLAASATAQQAPAPCPGKLHRASRKPAFPEIRSNLENPSRCCSSQRE